MAQRRMTSLEVIDTDAFLDMPVSSQNLYFHLNARADDDGFVSNPKRIIRALGANADDLKLLVGKKFLIAFEDGVCVIKHWRINNFIRKDIYKETQYLDLKSTLFIRPNGAYTHSNDERSMAVPKGHYRLEDVDATLTQRQLREGKDSVVKDTNASGIPDQRTPSKKYSYTDDDVKLAQLLFSKVRANTPTVKEPSIEAWANECRLMREVDKRTHEQMRYLIIWSQNDTFWKANILSMAKIRAKFDTLVAHIKRDKDTVNGKPANVAFT